MADIEKKCNTPSISRIGSRFHKTLIVRKGTIHNDPARTSTGKSHYDTKPNKKLHKGFAKDM